MFPKKRKQKEHNINPPKVSRKDNPQLPPDDDFTIPSSVNWNDPSDKHTKNFSQYPQPSSSIPHSSSPDPIDLSRLDEYANLASVSTLDWQETENFIAKNSSIQQIPKPVSPDAIDLSRLDEYANLASVSTLDWQETENFIAKNSSIQQIPKPISPPPIDLSRLDEYANLASTSTLDWKETENFINQSLFDNQHPPKPIPIVSVFDTNNPTTSTLELNLRYDYQNIPPIIPYIPQTSYINNFMANSQDDDDDDTDNLLTSDDIFQIMKYLCDSTNNKTYLTASPFIPVAKHMPYLNNIIDNFNSTLYNMSITDHSPKELALYSMQLKNACVRICSTLKEVYRERYPVQQILNLLESNTIKLECLPLLEHEDGIRNLLNKYKKLITQYSYSGAQRKTTKENQKENVAYHISDIAEGFKKIYNL